jgi:uridylate kinase
VLVKLSGESLCRRDEHGIDLVALQEMARLALDVQDLGVEIALLAGGGNFFRGRALSSRGVVRRTTGDSIGMLATVMNALALQDAIESEGGRARAMTSIEMPRVAESFTARAAVRFLNQGMVVIFGGGTGNPFFTTDTAAALRAAEIGAGLLVKATKVDGVYSDDPVKNPEAERYSRLSYLEVLEKGLGVMDATAITLCMEQRLPIAVLDARKPGALARAIRGEDEGTLIRG